MPNPTESHHFDGPDDCPPELAILLCCARKRLNPDDTARLQSALDGTFDWDELIRLARINRLMPLLNRHLKDIRESAIPRSVSRQLANAAGNSLSKTQALTEYLLTLSGEFERLGLPYIAFKGPTTDLVYGEPGLRGFDDIDVLCRRRDIPTVSRLFLDAGFNLTVRLNETERRVFEAYHHAYNFVRPDTPLKFDLHWSLLPANLPIPIDYEGLWSRVRMVSVAGQAVPTFGVEDTLLYLAIHASKEGWKRLRMTCDVAELIRAHPDLDWDTALAVAERQGGRRMLLLAVHLASTWLDAPVPQTVRATAAGDPQVEGLTRTIWQWIRTGNERPISSFRISDYYLSILDRPRDRVAYVVKTITLPTLTHARMVRLPASMVAGYVPVKLTHDYLLLPLWMLFKNLRKLLFR